MEAYRGMRMNTEDNREKKKRPNKLFMYGWRILFAIALVVLICWVAGVVWRVFNGMGTDGNGVFETLSDTRSGVVSLVFLIGVAVKVITSIPDNVREAEYNEQKRSDKYDAFLGEYFSGDKAARKDMLRVLRLIDDEHYSTADEVCVRLSDRCTVPEEQAAVLYCRMLCREEMGYTKEAIACGEKAVSLRKGYMPALVKTAQLCIKLNKMMTAEQYLLEAKECGGQELPVGIMLYQVYMSQNRHQEALDAKMACEGLDSHSGEVAACVCRAAHKCGRSDIVNSRLQKCAEAHYEGYAALKKEVRGY